MISRNVRYLSMLMVILMIVSTLASLSILPVFADETDTTGEGDTQDVIDDGGEADEDNGEDTEPVVIPEVPIEESVTAYLNEVFTSREEKLATMQLKLTKGDYQLYVQAATGEVAVKNTKTGQIILSNPYETSTYTNEDTRMKLLSQIMMQFKNITNDNAPEELYSYRDSSKRGQISVTNIKNGIRVDYILGKQAAKKLMPYWMEAQRFEQMILAKIAENPDDVGEYKRFMSYYTLYDPNDQVLEDVNEKTFATYACTKATNFYKTSTSYTIKGKLYEDVERTYEPGDHMAIYVVAEATAASERETNLLEGYIKQYCPEYNYEQLEYDVQLTGYVGDDSSPLICTMAIEWYLDEKGFYYQVPMTSISFDEDVYQLDFIEINKFLGCTCVKNDGYAFFPDGSGAIISNSDMAGSSTTYNIAGPIYGPDYSYHDLSKMSYTGKSEIITMPVFGIIDNTKYVTQGELIEANGLLFEISKNKYGELIINDDGTYEYSLDAEGNKIPIYKTAAESEVTANTTPDANGVVPTDSYYLTADPEQAIKKVAGATETDPAIYYYVDAEGAYIQQTGDIYKQIVSIVPQGHFAIIESGEALATMNFSYGGDSQPFSAISTRLYPISSDTYNLAEAISVGANGEWTVTSARKYTGKYTVRYFMLADYENSVYKGNYMSMAKAYRDYLEAKGVISLINDAKTDIPLYIESYGTIMTQETFLTIPVWVDTPITTFDDVKTMYKTLAENEDYSITNLNFRLTGFTDGGLGYTSYPTKVKFEKVLGGSDGYESLIADAKEKGYGVFPEFDFANVMSTMSFSGFKYSSWNVKTIDDRYASKRQYDATYQSFQYIGSVVVSPAYFSSVLDLFAESFDNYSYSGISAGTLGSDLNSDFDEDEPYNREDNKSYTLEMLKSLNDEYGDTIMLNIGNAYTWAYAKHILNVTLDSSRFLRASASIPFIGLVLHGSINIAGTPTNMEGDISYELLKIIENGAAPYFTLSYQNTSELKESYPEYYSVDFSIWLEDLISSYKTLNEALKDVQTSQIDDHRFITGNRVLTEAEKAQLTSSEAAAREQYQEDYDTAKLKYDNKLALAKKVAQEEGKVFDEAAYIEENGEFEFMTFDEYYESEIATIISDYTIIYEIYENGIAFILNYNSFPVTVTVNETQYTVEATDFVKIPSTK